MDDVIALFHRYKDPVYRLALSFTGSAADAEDVTQTVFLKYLETQPELEVGKEKAWLLQVTANQCRDLWRRLRRRACGPPCPYPGPVPLRARSARPPCRPPQVTEDSRRLPSSLA